MTEQISLSSLQNAFEQALKDESSEKLAELLTGFDNFCRNEVEATEAPEQKQQLIEQLMNTQKDWQSKILQLKSKVRENIADIKSNGKKINKYLTSY